MCAFCFLGGVVTALNFSSYQDPWLKVNADGEIEHFDPQRMAEHAEAGCPYAKAFLAVYGLPVSDIVNITELTWETNSADVSVMTAKTPFFTYTVHKSTDGWAADIGSSRIGGLLRRGMGYSLDDAQKACQDDFSERVLSIISPSVTR